MRRNASNARIQGLDAIVLIADRFDEQVQFYEKVLGLPVAARYRGAVFFDVGEQKLAIFDREHHIEGTKRLGGATHGISHFEFRVAASDGEEIRRRLDDAKARAYGENFEDPDGNLFHFNDVRS